MSGETVLMHCSPTLAGLKTGNLFSFEFSDYEELKEELRQFNRLLSGKGVRIIPLFYHEGRALIYVYRPNMLKKDLEQDGALEILREKGYMEGSINLCVIQLMDRLKNKEEFPHEIGIFLGYPPEDVKGFILHQAAHYKVRGHWKVYGDEKEAEKKFNRYKKCTEVYLSQWAKGKSVERLTVAV